MYHAGALGWVALITFGSIYTLVPTLWKRERMYSAALIEWHFWLAIAGTLICVLRDVEFRHHPGADVADPTRKARSPIPSSIPWWRCILLHSTPLAACCS